MPDSKLEMPDSSGGVGPMTVLARPNAGLIYREFVYRHVRVREHMYISRSFTTTQIPKQPPR